MDEIIRWIVSVLAVIIAAFILIIKKQGSGGKTSQEVKDRLEDLNKQIEQKKKEVDKLAKETEEIYKKNDEKKPSVNSERIKRRLIDLVVCYFIFEPKRFIF